MAVDLKQKQIALALRTPDAQGNWSRDWRDHLIQLPISDAVLDKIKEPDGTRYAVLDVIVEVPIREVPEPTDMSNILGYDGGVRTLITVTVVDLDGHQLTRPFFLDMECFDAEQAHTRRQIDVLKAKVAQLEAHRDRLQGGDARRERCLKTVPVDE